jgi:hypothetical protein
MMPRLLVLSLIANLLSGCTTSNSNPVADMPSWMSGLPADAPPVGSDGPRPSGTSVV